MASVGQALTLLSGHCPRANPNVMPRALPGFYSLSPQKSSVPDNPVQLTSGVLKRHSYRLEISVVA